MQHRPVLKKPESLTAAIIADMNAGEERGDALREIRLGDVGPVTLAKARTWLQSWADHMNALTTRNVVSMSAARAA